MLARESRHPFLLIMKEKLNNLIEKLERKIREERMANPHDMKVSGRFMFGRCNITFFYDREGCEIDIYNLVKDTLLDNIAEYCSKRVTPWIYMNVEDDSSDEWNDHGFRDEADYLRYKFG